eukprot:1147902-Pelagomonas_calceolata.AAC.3
MHKEMLWRQFQTSPVLLKVIFFCKVISHAGIAGNECADEIAKYQAGLKNNSLTDIVIPSAGPGGNPFHDIALLAWEEARASTSESSSPIPNLMLGYADHKTGYYTDYQSLQPHANKGISNAF